MKRFSFVWNEPASLAIKLRKPLGNITVDFAHPVWGPTSVTLWRRDGSGLRISSEMRDIREQLEVGVLVFELVAGSLTSGAFGYFGEGLTASKLIIQHPEASAESGIVLRVKDGSEITVVAGAFPLTLAVNGLNWAFDPEYHIEQYERMEM